MPAINERGDAVRICLYVQPRAACTEVVGEHGDAIKLRIAAPPVEGEANREVIRFLAKILGVSASQLHVVSGETGRRKVIEVNGVSAEFVRTRLLS